MDTIHTFDPLLVKLDSFGGLLFCRLTSFSGSSRILGSKRDFANKHDIILRYSKSNDYIFNADAVRIDYNLDASKYKSEKSLSHKGTNKSYKSQINLPKIPEDHWKIFP